MKTSKVSSPSIRHFRTIPRPASIEQNKRMAQSILEQLETAREIDDLQSQIANQRLQLTFNDQQLRTLRLRLNRYEAILGNRGRSMSDKTLEVHEHWIIKSNISPSPRLIHSHFGGDAYHEHPGYGPGSYTIDKNEWLKKTGMAGERKKRFTAKPSGPQVPLIEVEPTPFVVVMGPPSPPAWGSGPGISLPERISQSFKLPYIIKAEEDDAGEKL
jgi:hypothetical protein